MRIRSHAVFERGGASLHTISGRGYVLFPKTESGSSTLYTIVLRSLLHFCGRFIHSFVSSRIWSYDLGDPRRKSSYPAHCPTDWGREERLVADPLRVQRRFIIGGATRREHSGKSYVKPPLSKGWAVIHHRKTGKSLTIRFESERVPYLTVWANCGGLKGDHDLAVEPISVHLDRLDKAMEMDQVSRVMVKSTVS